MPEGVSQAANRVQVVPAVPVPRGDDRSRRRGEAFEEPIERIESADAPGVEVVAVVDDDGPSREVGEGPGRRGQPTPSRIEGVLGVIEHRLAVEKRVGDDRDRAVGIPQCLL